MGDKIDLGKIGYDVYITDKGYQAQLVKMEKSAERSANNVGSAFARLGTVIAAAFSFRTGLNEARRFSKELANVKSIADNFSKGTLRKEILKLNPVLGTAAELTNALFFAYSSGVQGTEREMAQFTGKVAELAKTIGAGITPTMDAFTTIMNAYGLGVKDAGEISDWFFQIIKYGKAEGAELAAYIGQIISTAAMAKIPLDELGAAIAELSNTMPASQAITALNQVILGFIQPTSEAKRVAAEFGIELSAATLKNRGLAGALAEVNAKAGDNVDALTTMFTSVRAFKAAASLAGTQAQSFQRTVTEFANKGGAAAKGFTESIDNLDDQLIVLTNTGKRLLEMMTNITLRIVTLNGVLMPIFSKIGKINASTLETIAKLVMLAAGLAAVRKAASGLSALKGGFINLAVKGGYQTAEMKEAAATQTAEIQKQQARQRTEAMQVMYLKKHEVLLAKQSTSEAAAAVETAKAQLSKAEAESATLAASQRNTALHESLSAKRIMLDRQEAASVAAKALAIEQSNLRILKTQNESARYQYTMMNGNATGFKPDSSLIESQKQVNILTNEYTNAQKAAAKASEEFTIARQSAVSAANIEFASTRELTSAREGLESAQKNLRQTYIAEVKVHDDYTVAAENVRKANQLGTVSTEQNTQANNRNTVSKRQNAAAGKADTASTNANTGATNANTAAQNANTGATVAGTKANNFFIASLKTLKAALLANPITAIIVALSAAAAVMMVLADRARAKAEELMETARMSTKTAEDQRRQTEKNRKTDQARIERLKQLQEKEKLNNDEMTEAETLISALGKNYGDLGASIDKATGKLNVQAGAWAKVKKQMLEVEKSKSIAIMKARAREIELIDAKYKKNGKSREYFMGGLLYKEKQSNTSLRDLGESELQRMMQSDGISPQRKELIKQYLDARDAWRTENRHYKILDSGNFGSDKDEGEEINDRIEAAPKEKELQREIKLAELKRELLKDNVLSREDELKLVEKQIKLEGERAAELEKISGKYQKSDDLATRMLGLEAQRDAARARANQYELEREKRDKEREILEEKLSGEMRKATAAAWTDGRMTSGEQTGLAQLNRDQAQERVAAARRDVDKAPTAALREEARKILEEQQIKFGEATAALREALQAGGGKHSIQAAVKGSLEDYQLRMNTQNNISHEMLTELKNQTRTQEDIREDVKNNKTPVTVFGKIN